MDSVDPPSSMLAGEAFLSRIYDIYKGMQSESSSNVWNTALLIGWDEPGGTYDHVPPGAVPPPEPDAPAGELGFKFDRSGYRVPAILVSPWIPEGSVFNDEYRHTSLIATLRKTWNLGEAFTQRDASARTFDDLFTLDEPRDPQTWATITALPLPASHLDQDAIAKGLSGLGKSMGPGVIEQARELGVKLPPQLDDPNAEITPEVLTDVLRQVAWHFFPRLGPDVAPGGRTSSPGQIERGEVTPPGIASSDKPDDDARASG
jgi:phospholipase C